MFRKLILSMFIAGVVVFIASTPAEAAITIKDNARYSVNRVKFTQRLEQLKEQRNEADVENEVEVENNTGDNEANDNTGRHADVEVKSGGSTTEVKLKTAVNTNYAGDECGCVEEPQPVDVKIAGNGRSSQNTVQLRSVITRVLEQKNEADIENEVEVENDTGDNEANDNTGGTVKVTSGRTTTTIRITNLANSNVSGSLE